MKFASLRSFRVRLSRFKRRQALRVSIRASVASSKVRFIEHVKAVTYTSATVSLGPRLRTNAEHAYICLYREVCLNSRGSCPGCFVRGFFVRKVLFGVVFVHPSFCQNTSITTES